MSNNLVKKTCALLPPVATSVNFPKFISSRWAAALMNCFVEISLSFILEDHNARGLDSGPAERSVPSIMSFRCGSFVPCSCLQNCTMLIEIELPFGFWQHIWISCVNYKESILASRFPESHSENFHKNTTLLHYFDRRLACTEPISHVITSL